MWCGSIVIIGLEDSASLGFSIFGLVARKLRAKCYVQLLELSLTFIFETISPLVLNLGFYAYMSYDFGDLLKPTQPVSQSEK